LVPNSNIPFGGSGASRNVTVAPAADQFGTALITITVSDGAATASTAFVVTVNPVNDPPTLDNINSLSINQAAGLQTVILTGITSGAANETQNLAVSAISSNPGLIPHPIVNYISPNSTIAFGGSGANRTFTITPAPGQFGFTVITLSVSDSDGNTTSKSFVLLVNPLNNPPTLDPIADLNINEDPGRQFVRLTGITS